MADKSLFNRLKRLFSTNVVIRNIGGKQLKVTDTERIQSFSDLNTNFLKSRGLAGFHSTVGRYGYSELATISMQRLVLFRDYDLMECISGDTRIPLPDGTCPTIKELSQRIEPLYVFSYDSESNSVKLGKAHHIHSKGIKKTIKLIFDNGENLILTKDHPVLMRNGEYKLAGNISTGESIMPFYRKDFYKNGYRSIYNFNKGWQSEHRIIAEQFYGNLLDNEVVHHKDFDKTNNNPENLRIMDKSEHKSFHLKINNLKIWSKENYEKQVKSIRNAVKNRKHHHWNGKRSGENNPFYGKHHTIEVKNKQIEGNKKYYQSNDTTFENNPNFKHNISKQIIEDLSLELYKNTGKFTLDEISSILNCDKSTIRLRIGDWKTFKSERINSMNHKVSAIEDCGEIEVFDMTVDKYYNFATEHCFVHNCDPIIASALDIYADEATTKNEFGDVLTIKSDDDKIKEVLHNLFYDILNVEFNLWPWMRTLPVKWDTYIPLLSGENITIKELSDRLKLGNEEYVYSIQDKTHKIVPGKVIWCDKNISENKIVKIVFDDDTFVETAPSHPFILRNGTEIRADELKINDSLMPFYRKLSENKKDKSDINFLHEYELIYDANLNDYDYTHRLIANTSNIKKDKERTILHHVDFNKYNNCPYNLIPMNYQDHKLLHAKHCKKILHTPEVTKKRMEGISKWLKSDKHKKQLQDSMKGIYPKYFEEYNISDLHTEHNSIRSIKAKEQWSNPKKRRQMMDNMKNSHKNHKVKSIEIIEDFSDVYCMTVVGLNGEDDRHNFAICGKDNSGNINKNSGVFVKNCKYGDHFLKLEISENYGIINVIPVSPYEITREEGFDPENPFRVKFKHEGLLAGQLEYENYEIAHFRLANDPNFLPYGKCLSQYTTISTTLGPKYIKDIEVGDEVYSWDDNNKKVVQSKVLDKILSGTKRVYEIKTAHRKIYATYEHPILTNEGEYKQVKDLSLDDYLILPVINIQNEIEYPKLLIEETDINKFDNKLILMNEKILKDNFKELVRFFGFMLGDGWTTNNTVCFSLGDRLDKSQKYIDFIERLGLNYRIGEKNTSRASCIINSTYFKRILEQLEFITGTNNKVIPNWIWNLPLEYKQELLFGFTDADGCDIDDNTFQLGTINEKLIDGLRQIAIECGMSTTKKWTTHTKGCTGKGCDMYLFTYKFTSRDFKKINENYYIEKIRSIKESQKDDVYDIQIDNNFHNFIAEGIVVHNSMIESGRRVWKQLQLMEDAMLIHRIMRAPEKRIFRIDTGNIAPNETEQYIKSVVNKIKKVPYVDPRTGEYNLKYNMMNMTEDFFIPVRGGDSGTSIESLPGLEYNAIEDIEYLRNKMMSALKIPKAFLGYEEGIAGKATLAAEDVRFAKTIERIQKIFVSELSKIAVIHLYTQGFKDDDIVNFELTLTNPSTIYEQEKIALWQEKVSLIRDMQEIKLFSNDWIYKQIINFSQDEIEKQKQKVLDDVKTTFRVAQIENEGNDPYITNQTFGTPHDLAMMYKGIKSSDEKPIDFGTTNFKMNWDDSTGKKENITDDEDYDKDYNENDRQPSNSKYGQDSHIRGRDPLGAQQHSKSINPTTRKVKVNPFVNINKESLDSMLNKIKSKELIKESLKNTDSENEATGSDDKTYLDESNLLDL